MILPNIVAIGIFDSKITKEYINVSTTSAERKTIRFEIEIPIEKGGISYINDKEYPIRPDSIICVKPNQIRHTRFPFKCYYIHIKAKQYNSKSLYSFPFYGNICYFWLDINYT